MKRKHLWSAVLVCVGLISACSNGAVEEQSVEEGGAERPLRIAFAADLPNLDPHFDLTHISSSLLGNLCETLVAFDIEGVIIPSLAVEWENTDDLTWRFLLRENVVFHNDQPLTAADVVASLMRAQNHPQSMMTTYLASVQSIEADGDSAVVIRTHSPDPVLLSKLVFVHILPADTPDLLESLIGTGPYRLEEYLPGDRLRARRFEDYWGERASENAVEFLFRQESQHRVELLLGGSVDIIESVPPEHVEAIEGATDLWVESHLGGFIHYLALNRNLPPLDNPDLREAMDVALNRQAFADDVFFGYARPASQIPSPQTFGFADTIAPTTHNLERAKHLIRKAGLDSPPELTLHYSVTRQTLADAILDQLNAAGFKASGESHSWSELVGLLETTEVQAFLIGENNSSLDPGVFFESVVHTRSPEQSLGDFNHLRFSDEEMDRLIEHASQQMNPSLRLAEIQAMSEKLSGHRVVLPLVATMELYGVRRDLEWTPRADNRMKAVEMVRRVR
jgi:peptide/nickel transport system substrate-binding protein